MTYERHDLACQLRREVCKGAQGTALRMLLILGLLEYGDERRMRTDVCRRVGVRVEQRHGDVIGGYLCYDVSYVLCDLACAEHEILSCSLCRTIESVTTNIGRDLVRSCPQSER